VSWVVIFHWTSMIWHDYHQFFSYGSEQFRNLDAIFQLWIWTIQKFRCNVACDLRIRP